MGKWEVEQFREKTLIELANRGDSLRVALFLKEQSMKISDTPSIYLDRGLALSGMQLLLDLDTDLIERIYEPMDKRNSPKSLLAWLFYHGNTDRIQLLLQNGIDVNGRDSNGRTALIQCMMHGEVDRLTDFIALGANADLQDSDGLTALMHYIPKTYSYHHIGLVCSAMTNFNAQDKYGRTALMYAARSNKTQWMQDLLKYGADPFIKRVDGLDASAILAMNPIRRLIKDYTLKRNIRQRETAY